MKLSVVRVLNFVARVGDLRVHALNENEAIKANKFLPHAESIDVVQNGVPSDILAARMQYPQRSSKSGDIIIGCMSRIAPKKNQLALIALAALIRDSRPDLFDVIRFSIDGSVEDAAYAQSLTEAVAAKNLNEKFDFRDSVQFDERANYISSYDIFFFPSKSEGMPYVVLEAVALGVLPIVSKTSACDFVEPFGGIVYEELELSLIHI